MGFSLLINCFGYDVIVSLLAVSQIRFKKGYGDLHVALQVAACSFGAMRWVACGFPALAHTRVWCYARRTRIQPKLALLIRIPQAAWQPKEFAR